MRVLIIDDERLARSELRRLLSARSEIEIVGEAATVDEAVSAIRNLQPDLLLLDVQLPGGSGFDVLMALDEAPDVIFTTAYDRYALRAFEVNALDYLQKPIEAARLEQALAKALASISRKQAPLSTTQKIFIKDGERCWFVRLSEIVLFESEGNYTRVYFDGNRPLILRSLNQLESRLDPKRFFRANRRHIANLDSVEQVHPSVGGALALLLKNGIEVEVSRRRAAEFRALASL